LWIKSVASKCYVRWIADVMKHWTSSVTWVMHLCLYFTCCSLC